MSSNVIGLRGERPAALGEPRQELIDVLENLLERAKSGQIQSFIGTGFTSDGCRISAWADCHDNIYEMQGALSWLQHEYVHRHTEALS